MSMNPSIKRKIREHIDLIQGLLSDLATLLNEVPSHPFADYGLKEETPELFSFPHELDTIMEVAREYFPDPHKDHPVNPFALMLAIREAEKGRAGLEFGIMHPKAIYTDLRTQAAWCAATIRANFTRFKNQDQYADYVDFLGSRYAPAGADNDPGNLNQHWPGNVRFFYERFHEAGEGGVRP